MPVSATQDCTRRKIQDLIDHPAEHGIGFCIIGYGLCRACSLEPAIVERVESKIFRLKSVC